MRWNFRNVAPNGMLLAGNYVSSLEYQMSKRKPAMAPKHAYRPSIAAKAQRASQTIVRSPKNSVPRAVGGGSTKPSPEHHTHPEQDAPFVEHADLLTKDPETSLQVDSKQITENDSKKRIDFLSSANANVRTYQAKLL